MSPSPLFVSCLPGLEPLLETELEALGISALAAEPGGVRAEGELSDVYAINLRSGIASHVLIRLAGFQAVHLHQLRRRTAGLPWSDWISAEQPVVVQATCRKSALYHSGAVAERVTQAIGDALGAKPPTHPDESAVSIAVRIHENRATVAIDTSGRPLHRRGWRLAGAKAPLREDIAHALILASGWDPNTPLLDPMTGAGTIAIEAAGIARRLPPGRLRQFAFEQLRPFSRTAWETVQADARASALPAAPGSIHTSDRDLGAVEAARSNAERAGVAADLEVRQAAFSSAAILDEPESAPDLGAIVSNPPYGRRVGQPTKLNNLYQALGHRIAKLPPTWRVALCSSDRRLALRTGLTLQTAFTTQHGGSQVRALVGNAEPAPKSRGAGSRAGRSRRRSR